LLLEAVDQLAVGLDGHLEVLLEQDRAFLAAAELGDLAKTFGSLLVVEAGSRGKLVEQKKRSARFFLGGRQSWRTSFTQLAKAGFCSG
jgi:hypothetical protein